MKEIQRLQLIRRIHEDLNLSLPAIEVILNLREQIQDLNAQRSAIELKLMQQQVELNHLKNKLRQFQKTG